jgi:putative transposase
MLPKKLNAEEFGSVLEAKVVAKEWRHEYNHVRPHSWLGYRTPAEFVRTLMSRLVAFKNSQGG